MKNDKTVATAAIKNKLLIILASSMQGILVFTEWWVEKN